MDKLYYEYRKHRACTLNRSLESLDGEDSKSASEMSQDILENRNDQ